MVRAADKSSQLGATLIECVTAILVLGIAIPPLVNIFREVAAHDTERTLRGVGVMYAESMMEEIISKAYEDPDEATGSFGTEEALRLQYDDIDDFDGLSNSPPTRLDGTPLADYAGFRRRVAVDNVADADPDPSVPALPGPTKLKRVTVTVDWPGGDFALTSLRTLVDRGPSPLAEDLSGQGATDDGKKKVELPLINISGRDLLIESVSLTANVPTDPLHRLDLENKEIYHEHAGHPLPTGIISLSGVKEKRRTIAAFEAPVLEIEFDSQPVGTVTYTLAVYFTEGTSSVIPFTIAW